MTYRTAATVALELNGSAHHIGGKHYLVLFYLDDGRVVAMDDGFVCEYANEKAFLADNPKRKIDLR